jgi:hypothetical protein
MIMRLINATSQSLFAKLRSKKRREKTHPNHKRQGGYP